MNIEVISLIYKSVDFLNLICSEFKINYNECKDYSLSFRLVANDPVQDIIDALPNCEINYTIYNDKNPKDFYLNRVYRAWNFAVNSSESNFVCLVNSDMLFSNFWLDNLVNQFRLGFLPTSLLAESGRYPSKPPAFTMNFGKTYSEIRKSKWLKFAERARERRNQVGGLYMPVLFDKKEFLDCGGYPEGNIFFDGIGTLNGPVIESGDAWFFRKFERKTKRKHVTVFDSLVYHLQEGEMRS